MASPAPSNARTWLLLLLAMVPTCGVLAVGVAMLSARSAEMDRSDEGRIAVETSVELFLVSSSLQRAEAGLAGAALLPESDELRRQGADSLEAARATVETSTERIAMLISALTARDGEAEEQRALETTASAFELARRVLDQQPSDAPPTSSLELVAQLARENAGGLFLPVAGSDSRKLALLRDTLATTVAYHDEFDAVRRDTLDAFERGVEPDVATDLLESEWKDLLESRQFAVSQLDIAVWSLTEVDVDNPPFLLRSEPLTGILNDEGLDTEAQLLRIDELDRVIDGDLRIAEDAIRSTIDEQQAQWERERTLIVIGLVLMTVLGLALLRLAIVEVRHRRNVEDAHDDAIEQLHELARRDPITGAGNRRYLETTLRERLEAVATDGGSVVLAYVDLDRFKAINDVWGHHTGDAVLSVVADRLRALRHGGTEFEVVRFGGDEFVMFATVPAADPDWLAELGPRIIDDLSHTIDVDGREHCVSASAGITVSTGGSTIDVLLLEADSSLILAKRNKRGSAIVHDRDVARTGELVHALPTAMISGEVECYLQPVIDLSTGRVRHVEALARWVRPSGELVSPNVFVPLVESFGLAAELTSAVLRNVAGILHDPNTPDDVRVWVNLSPVEVEFANFADRFIAELDGLDIDTGRIGVEITETAAVRDPDGMASELQRLRDAGVSTAIDDFGNGYSPLGLLRNLPIDVVKLDRSLIDHIDRDRGGQQLVTGIIGLLTGLGIDITAEGVERIEEERWLRSAGVGCTQGFLRGRPRSSAGFDWALLVEFETLAIARP